MSRRRIRGYVWTLLRLDYPATWYAETHSNFVFTIWEVNDFSLLWFRTYVEQRHVRLVLFNRYNLWIPYWFKRRTQP